MPLHVDPVPSGRASAVAARPPAPVVRSRRLLILGGVIALLVAISVVDRWGPAHAGLVVGPVCAGVLLLLARRAGLSWDDLGLARRSWRRGAAYGAGAALLVAAVYAVAVALPGTRSAFLDARYHMHLRTALITTLVVIPLGTVLLEEVAFRGVLLGLVRHHKGTAWATGVSSGLFGLWHVLPSLHFRHANPVGAALGHGTAAQVAVVAATVGFTAVAGLVFCELRRRSGSVLAAAGLHWATNGLGVVVATALWMRVG